MRRWNDANVEKGISFKPGLHFTVPSDLPNHLVYRYRVVYRTCTQSPKNTTRLNTLNFWPYGYRRFDKSKSNIKSVSWRGYRYFISVLMRSGSFRYEKTSPRHDSTRCSVNFTHKVASHVGGGVDQRNLWRWEFTENAPCKNRGVFWSRHYNTAARVFNKSFSTFVYNIDCQPDCTKPSVSKAMTSSNFFGRIIHFSNSDRYHL